MKKLEHRLVYTVENVAAILHVSRSAVFKLIKEGLPMIKLGKRRVISRQRLDDWLERKHQEQEDT